MSAFYRALLRLYPASFRADYGAELTRAYEERVHQRGRAAAFLAAVGDVVPNALAAHRDILWQDLKYTARSLVRARGFAIATILVTALGVGANTATFSVADFVLVRPLSYPNPQELVRLCEGPREGGGWGCNNELSPANFRDVDAKQKTLASLGAYARGSVNLVGSGDPLRVGILYVDPDVIPTLGVRPIAGRIFDTTAAFAADERTVILSYALWQSYFGGDNGALNSTLILDGIPHVVVGIMPRDFRFPGAEFQLWAPLVLREGDYANRNNTYLHAIGRLTAGVSFEQSATEMHAIAAQLRRDYPATNAETGFSYFKQRDEMSPRYRTMLYALCGASVCLLLLTCANIANLLLVRAASRERELAVRTALGAGRERLMRQLMTESVTLALLGGIAGAVVAVMTVPLLSRLIPTSLPLGTQPSVDVRVFAFAAAFAGLTGLGFGLIPALRVGARGVFNALRQGARGSGQTTRLRTALVAIEVCVSVVLLSSSALLIRAIWRVEAVPSGFSAAGVLTANTELPRPRYDSASTRAEFYRRVIEGVRALPGVQTAAYTSGIPMRLTGGIAGVEIPGRPPAPGRQDGVSLRLVSSEFFSTLNIPLRRGRNVSDFDTRERQLVAVVSESFAEHYWPGEDALGKTFTVRNDLRTVIGIVGNIKVRGLERSEEPQLYLPLNQPPEPLGGLYVPKDLVVRTTRDDPGLGRSIQQIVRQIDPQQPVSNVRTLSSVVGDQTAERRAQLRILGALASLALLLTAVGIHGLLAFTVSQRDREIGVRLALGANPGRVARMILGEGAKIALIGVIPGVIAAYYAARAMSTLLFGLRPNDPLTLSVVAALCFVTAVVACARPALRAAGIHPMSALRAD
jgi:predicted permease